VVDDGAAARLLAKIRDFVGHELDDEERALFATLIAPGVALAYAENDVSGYGVIDWSATSLPEALGRALRDSGIRVTGLEP
jgi:hypothetical protein